MARIVIANVAKSGWETPGPRAQALRPALVLEGGQEAAPAFMAEQVRDAGEGLRPVMRSDERDREREGEGAGLADRRDIEPCGKQPFPKERGGDSQARGRASLDRRKAGPDVSFQPIERFAPEDHQLHQVRRVAALVEIDELGPQVGAGAFRECRRGPDVESRERVSGVEGPFPRGEPAEPIAPASGDELRLDDRAFARDGLAVETGRDEELGEPVERAFEVPGVDLEEVGRMRERGAGVSEPAMLREEAVVLVRFGILFGPEKEYVFEKVRESRAGFRVVRAPDVDVEHRRRGVGARVRHDERLEPVGEHDRAVVPRVRGGCARSRRRMRARHRPGAGRAPHEPRRRSGGLTALAVK